MEKERIDLFRKVLANREFTVHFQPIVDILNGEIYSYEVLLRSKNPAFKGPLELLDAAVASRCSGLFGRLVRELAIETGPITRLFLNVHPAEMDEGWLVRPDDPIFQHEDEIFLEITESVPLSHFELCQSILREVRGKGIYLAVDDLGAGYSNLKYIADLSPEVVKIDRNLVAGIHRSRRQHKLVTSIVDLCTDLGALVVAEGIELIAELEAIKDTGAHFAQGFLLAQPSFPPPPVTWPPVKDFG